MNATDKSGTSAVISIEQAVVLRGQRAWSRIKSTAAEQRELWREVGEALNYGRQLHPSNQAFGKWCVEQGFGDMEAPVRSNAMWFAQQSPASCTACNTDLSHPTHIRQWHRENQPAAAPSPEVTLTSTDAPRKRITIATAKKANKLAAMAERGVGGERDIAKRHLDKFAKDHGMGGEEFVELAAKTDPMAGVSYDGQALQKEWFDELVGRLLPAVVALKEMQSDTNTTLITREALIATIDALCDELKVI